jgi:putative MATE family efflux protein
MPPVVEPLIEPSELPPVPPNESIVAGDLSRSGENEATPPAPLGPMTQRRVLGLAIPIIGENLLQTAVGAVDTLMVATLGSAALAGVGVAIEVVFFLLATLSAISVGATVLVAQAIGAGDPARANRVARQAVIWGVLLAIPVSIFGTLAAPAIIAAFGTKPDVAAAATVYLQVTVATSVGLLLSFVCGAVLRGAGDSRTPLVAAIVANLVNVAVAAVLIFGLFGFPALGVAGSAIGAAAGRAAGAALLLGLLVQGRRAVSLRGRAGWRPRPAIARHFVRLGVPAALEEMLLAAGFAVLMAVVALIGTTALAAQHVAFTALSVAFLPGFGFAIASTALVGQSIGAADHRAAWSATTIALRWAVAWMAIGGAVFFVFARPAMDVFSDDPGVIADGVRALWALSVGLPFWAIWFVCGGALRGCGDTRTPMIMSALSVWLAVGLAYGAVAWFGGGLGTVWLTFLLTAPIAAFGNLFVLRRRLRVAE